MKNHITKLRLWIPIALVVTGLCALVYITVQQEERQSANDMPTTISEGLSASLEAGQGQLEANLGQTIDISKRLDPFVIIFDKDGNVTSSNVTIEGKTPEFPKSALEPAKTKGQNRITWQPQAGVRAATVTTYFKGQQEGYVLAGQSLRETEKRVNMLTMEVFAAWIAIMGATLIATIVLVPITKDKTRT